MSSGAEVVVIERGGSSFTVEVHTDRRSTVHEVVVPAGLADALGWGGVPEADLVRASFGFLLEREPADSILRQFSLDVIGTYFPEYAQAMRRLVSGAMGSPRGTAANEWGGGPQPPD